MRASASRSGVWNQMSENPPSPLHDPVSAVRHLVGQGKRSPALAADAMSYFKSGLWDIPHASNCLGCRSAGTASVSGQIRSLRSFAGLAGRLHAEGLVAPNHTAAGLACWAPSRGTNVARMAVDCRIRNSLRPYIRAAVLRRKSDITSQIRAAQGSEPSKIPERCAKPQEHEMVKDALLCLVSFPPE
jgi:hypothetical protein